MEEARNPFRRSEKTNHSPPKSHYQTQVPISCTPTNKRLREENTPPVLKNPRKGLIKIMEFGVQTSACTLNDPLQKLQSVLRTNKLQFPLNQLGSSPATMGFYLLSFDQANKFTCLYQIFRCYCTLVLQFIGYSRHPKGLSCRTTFIIGYLITYLLYTAFAAGVTSLLAVQGNDIHLTFEDVVAMKSTLLASTHTTNLPSIASSPDSSTFWIRQNLRRIYNTKEVLNNEELFKGIEEDNVVGFGTAVNLNNYLWRRVPQHKKGDYTLSEILNSYSQESFIIQKNSPYKEPLNYWLLRLQEAGLLSLGRSRFMTVPHQSCCDSPGWSSAGLGNVLSAILILAGGFFFSIFILFCEMAWIKKTTSTKWEERSKQDVFRQYQKYNKRKKNRAPIFNISMQGGLH